ncbi:MAG: hypothetical protein AAF968_06335 [Pseudomonadota bacterium]
MTQIDDKTNYLNNGLIIEDFVIGVPCGCQIPEKSEIVPDHGDANNKSWASYIEELTHDAQSRLDDSDQTATFANEGEPEKGKTYFGHDCWILKGQIAFEHAKHVHSFVHKQLLRLSNISGVDIGFAMEEGDSAYVKDPEPVVALRIHTNQKLSPRLLVRDGIPNLSSLDYMLPTIFRRHDDNTPFQHWEDLAPFAKAGKRDPDLIQQTNPDDEASNEALEVFWGNLNGLMNGSRRKNFFYPIEGVEPKDIACHPVTESGKAPRQWNPREPDPRRLTICGVPIDILGASYRLLNRESDPARGFGVFVEGRQISNELANENALKTCADRNDLLVGGLSVGSTTGQAGTLSAIVWDRVDGKPCLLGNWHVLAGSLDAQAGQPIYQPARFDGGNSSDVVGHLKRSLLSADGDAAIAELNGARNYASGEVLGMWSPISGVKHHDLNNIVRKWGRTTGFTRGFVDGVQLTVDIDYGGGLVRRFENQFRIAPLKAGRKVSEPGDSGALVLVDILPESDTASASERSEENGLLTIFEGLKRNQNVPNWFTDMLVDVNQELQSSGLNLTGELLREFINSAKPILHAQGVDLDRYHDRMIDRRQRNELRIYFAVGMIFAGDTPGSPLGEFAIASDIKTLAEKLNFTLRPSFAPRKSFRPVYRDGVSDDLQEPQRRGAQRLAPGPFGSDTRPQGPTPDPESAQTGGGTGGGTTG